MRAALERLIEKYGLDETRKLLREWSTILDDKIHARSIKDTQRILGQCWNKGKFDEEKFKRLRKANRR